MRLEPKECLVYAHLNSGHLVASEARLQASRLSLGACPMDHSFWISTFVVALAEIGDKTQLLAILLAARFKRPIPIILGILVATLANHGLAATLGYFVSGILAAKWFGYVIGASFLAMGAWILVPDKAEELDAKPPKFGIFATTAIAFFLVENGDKTQIATVALAAKYHDIFWVAAGTTTGMMLANVPAVYLGEAATKVAPMAIVRMAAAGLFAAIGGWTLLQTSGLLG